MLRESSAHPHAPDVAAMLARESELCQMARRAPHLLPAEYERVICQKAPDPTDVRRMVSAILSTEFPPRR